MAYIYKHYIYTITCPKTQKVIYVGQTSGSTESRFSYHLSSYKVLRSTPIGKYIGLLKKDRLYPVFNIVEVIQKKGVLLDIECAKKYIKSREAYWINKYYKDPNHFILNKYLLNYYDKDIIAKAG